MKRQACVAATFLLVAGLARADFADCVLDKMPGTSNAAAAAAVYRTCSNDFPRRYSGIYKGVNRGFFAFKDAEACIIKKARDTAQPSAAFMIAAACRCLYDPPEFNGQTCDQPFTPQ